MTFETASQTDVGQVRNTNEDSVYASGGDDRALLVVADGMGGHAAGDVASEAAIDAFTEVVEPKLPDILSKNTPEVLKDGVYAANDQLRAIIENESKLDGMGTTLVAAVLTEDKVTFVNVGDSRGYHITEENIDQVTVDQSLVQELVEKGKITPEEAKSHPQRNVVSQALGTQESVDPDTFTIPREGWVLVCSDGLSEEVPDRAIHEIIIDANSPKTATQVLLQQANDNGGSDNISVAIGR